MKPKHILLNLHIITKSEIILPHYDSCSNQTTKALPPPSVQCQPFISKAFNMKHEIIPACDDDSHQTQRYCHSPRCQTFILHHLTFSQIKQP